MHTRWGNSESTKTPTPSRFRASSLSWNVQHDTSRQCLIRTHQPPVFAVSLANDWPTLVSLLQPRVEQTPCPQHYPLETPKSTRTVPALRSAVAALLQLEMTSHSVNETACMNSVTTNNFHLKNNYHLSRCQQCFQSRYFSSQLSDQLHIGILHKEINWLTDTLNPCS